MADRSKAQRILWLLHAAWPNWTPAPELAKISLQYAARVKELREAGWLIANRVEFHGRTKHGFYRLGITGAKTEPKNKTTEILSPSRQRSRHPDRVCCSAYLKGFTRTPTKR
jgi:hypothetical protein